MTDKNARTPGFAAQRVRVERNKIFTPDQLEKPQDPSGVRGMGRRRDRAIMGPGRFGAHPRRPVHGVPSQSEAGRPGCGLSATGSPGDGKRW